MDTSRIEDLKSRALEVKNASQDGENTANRIGQLLYDIADTIGDSEGEQGVPAITGYCDYLFGKDAQGNNKPAASESIAGAIDLIHYTGSPTQEDCINIVEGSVEEGWIWGGWSVKPGTAYIWKANKHVYRATNNGWEDEGVFNGKDGLVVSLSPQSIIMNQDPDTSEIDLSGARAVVTVMEGDVDMASFITVTATGNHCSVSVSGNTVIITGILQSEGQYYQTGYVDVSISYNSKTYVRRLSWAVNLVGMWKESIEGDIKTELAYSSFFEIDDDPESPTYGQIIENEEWGEFKRSSEENISVLTRKVGSDRNLIPVTSGWEGYAGATVNYEPKNFAVWDTDSDLYSPAVLCKEGGVYCFSAYMPDNAVNQDWLFCYGTEYQNLSDLYDNARDVMALTKILDGSIRIGENTYYRYYYKRAVTSLLDNRYVSINYAGSEKIYCPQVEYLVSNSDTPSAFTAKSLETTSQIKQTAEEINLTISNGLVRTGVDIESGKIRLDAENVEVTGTLSVPKVVTTTQGNNKKIVIDTGTFTVLNDNGTPGISIGWDDNGICFMLFSNADGSEYRRLDFSGLSTDGSQFTSDACSVENNLRPITLGVDYCDFIFYNGLLSSDYPTVYKYSAAKNLVTEVYSSVAPQGAPAADNYQQRRTDRDGKLMTTDDIVDILGTTGSSVPYPTNGYYLPIFTGPITPEQGVMNIVRKDIYTISSGVLTKAGFVYMRKTQEQGSAVIKYWFCNAMGADLVAKLDLSHIYTELPRLN